jgi:hypothetical protein
MMIDLFGDTFLEFLVEAKKQTYAGGGALTQPSRKNSKDLKYENGDYQYYDTYLGDVDFIGEEVVWHCGQPVWGMNYYGWMLVEKIPDGFSKCLKGALSAVPQAAPFRGPEQFLDGDFKYQCRWEGNVENFLGSEEIFFHGKIIYKLHFHGGRIKTFR